MHKFSGHLAAFVCAFLVSNVVLAQQTSRSDNQNDSRASGSQVPSANAPHGYQATDPVADPERLYRWAMPVSPC